MDRSLFDTVKMLQRGGVPAGARIALPRVDVWIDGTRWTWATFDAQDCPRAAAWLVSEAVRLYPRSEIAKVRRMVEAAVQAAASQKT